MPSEENEDKSEALKMLCVRRKKKMIVIIHFLQKSLL
jgi:hypothetical protein